ncbi:MAG TPA: FtsH protease activity modulator HflK [Methylococcaceae bacterium]|jgi:membrane protease subunit HflK|nr:FtsH protease activity modulator HflK [Methylococcaceae bacterium]HIA44404.1 FtsH protease activity modulator HflK [Methylococcaceae bacterium]HIN69054.1 FtsH protease activity modulator HflK [Methylococcales bacterium]
MAWNEPGDKDKDPWNDKKGQQKPPDLDEAIRSFQEKISNIFGGGTGGGSGGSGQSKIPGGALGVMVLLVAAVVLWTVSGFYIVDEGNHGVETRFGKFSETTMPGLNWHLPTPIEAVEIVNVQKQRFIEVGYRSGGRERVSGSVPRESLMLTKDENIVDVRLAVQYQIKDAANYLFNVKDQTATLKQATESVERGVIGRNDMNFVLLEGRADIVADIKKELQTLLDRYDSGIIITDVNLQDAQPPEQVQAAFEDAIKAREDKERYINEAEAYRNDVVPKARGAATRKIQEAEGYKFRVIAESQGETVRFTKLLAEYHKAPDVTRKRLYIDAMESVLSNTDTIMIDLKKGSNVMYLPLDRLGRGQGAPHKTGGAVNRADDNDPDSGSNRGSGTSRSSTRGREPRGRK